MLRTAVLCFVFNFIKKTAERKGIRLALKRASWIFLCKKSKKVKMCIDIYANWMIKS